MKRSKKCKSAGAVLSNSLITSSKEVTTLAQASRGNPQSTQAIIWISYDGITIGLGLNGCTRSCTQLIFASSPASPRLPPHPTPPPPPLVDMQLEKRAFNKALGTHTLPFQSRFHNRGAQLHRLTLTELCQMEPLVPPRHAESHPTQTSSHFPRAVGGVEPKWTRPSSSSTSASLSVPLNLIRSVRR